MEPKASSRRDGAGLLPLLLIAVTMLIPAAAFAAAPSWWSSYGVTSGTTPNDFSVANQGEAKNVAVAAVYELDNDLAQFGGAGATLDDLAATLLSSTAQAMDYAAVNRGQLKALAQPFYDRLLALGYNGTPLTTGTYPWAYSGGQPYDYAAVNIGQLKYAFSFDVTSSTSGNGIPDWWTNKYFPGQAITSGSSFVVWSGSQITLLDAYDEGLNPVDFYNGQPPVLSIVSGSGQTGSPGGFVPLPLIVSVTGTDGNAIVGAPLTFTVTTGTLQTSSGGTPAGSITVFADAGGEAQMYYQLPDVESSTNQITVTTGTASTFAQVTFSAYSDDGTGVFPDAFAPTNCTAVLNSDNSITLTWTNNADNALYILIEQQQSGGGWTAVSGTLSPTTTSYTVTSPIGSGPYRVDPYTPGSGGGSPTSNAGPPESPAIPTINYAAINISGTYTNGIDVSMITLSESNNNAAFEVNAPADSIVESATSYTVYTWQGGVLSAPVTTANNVPLVEGSGTTETQFQALFLTATGKLLGQLADGYGIPYLYNDGPPLSPPNPPFDGIPIPDVFYLDCVSDNGQFLAGPLDSDVFVSGSGFSGVQCSYTLGGSNTWTIYDYGPDDPEGTLPFPTGPVESNVTAYPAQTTPVCVGDQGWTVGSGTDSYTVYWSGSGTSLTSLSPMQYPIAINDAGQVIGFNWETGTAYLWSTGTAASADISTLVPKVFQNGTWGIYPIDISGTDASGSYGILFSGTYEPTSGAPTTSGTFLLTFTGTTSFLQQIIVPSNIGVTLSQYNGSINLNDVIAALGTSPAASGTAALLLVPMNIDFMDPSVATWDDTNELPEKQVILFADNTRIRIRFHDITLQNLTQLETATSGTSLHLTTNVTDPAGADFPLTSGSSCTFATGNDENGSAYSDIRVVLSRSQIQQLGLLPQQENTPASKAWYDTGANDPTAPSNLTDSEAFAASNTNQLMGQASFFGHLNTPSSAPAPGGPNLPIDYNNPSKTFLQAAGGEVTQATCIGISSSDRMIAHQASTFYYSGHGYYNPGTLILNGSTTNGLPTGPQLAATDVIWDKNLNTAIIAGCSIFGIRDDKYGIVGMRQHDADNFERKWHDQNWGTDPSPGEKWEPLAPKYKLGYFWEAPADNQNTAGIIHKFYQLVNGGLNPIQAWGQANYGTAGVYACAIDTSVTPHEYWYFNDLPIQIPFTNKILPAFRTWIHVTKGSSGW